VIVNPTKYTVKNEDEQQDCCDVSLNDSYEDEDELIKEEKKNNKKGDKKKKNSKKSTPKAPVETPKGEQEQLDPAELMPNLKIGIKERKRKPVRRGRDSSDSDSEQPVNAEENLNRLLR